MDIEQFEALFVKFQNSVRNYGSDSEEATQTMNEIEKNWTTEPTPEQMQVLIKLGIVPTPEPTPISLALVAYDKAVKNYGEDSNEAIAAFMTMMDVAPQEYLDEADKVFKDMFGEFKTIAVTEEGKPLCSLDEVAEKLGISTNEAINHLFKMEAMAGKKLRHEGEHFSIH